MARRVAVTGNAKNMHKQHQVGAVGVRKDGAIVVSSNISTRVPEPEAHAEARLAKKLDWGATVYVARILRDGTMGLARPCKNCMAALRWKGVKIVYYSISNIEYGVLKL
jgi:tRNA(Arg) A34 adenosine deaminase TadA